MSEKVSRLAVQALRNFMFPALPPDIQSLFPVIQDTLVVGSADQVPNIVIGQYQDYGTNAGTLIITVDCSGPTEGLVRQYKHLDLDVEIWATMGQSPNVDGRRVVSIIHEYVRRALQDTNWSGALVSIQRCYQIQDSTILFEGANKTYHKSDRYRVEALSAVWY